MAAERALSLFIESPQEYPGNELLLVYDKDFKYGLNFYIIGTEEGKENYLNVSKYQA